MACRTTRLVASGWLGPLSASGLLIGAVGGYYASLRHRTIATVMTFAAGVLLAVVAVDLVIEARDVASLHWTVMGLLFGAAGFSSVNWLLSRHGAKHRKRCGECVEQPKEEQQLGSGLAIAAGTFLPRWRSRRHGLGSECASPGSAWVRNGDGVLLG